MQNVMTSPKDTRYKDRNWLYKQYWEEERSKSEIATLLGCTVYIVAYWMKKHKIQARSVKQAVILQCRKHPRQEEEIYKNADWLQEQYWGQMKSYRMMGREAGCGACAINYWLKKRGIPLRTSKEDHRLFEQKLRKERTGLRFSRLITLEYLGKDSGGRWLWKCQCDCGNIHIVNWNRLQTGNTKSCGCLKDESAHRNLPKGPRKPPEEVAFNALLRQYQYNAKNRGYPFELSTDEFHNLTKGECYYCGESPIKTYYTSSSASIGYVYNGIDRLDNSKGYIKENSVSCCFHCNHAKSTRTEGNFLAWIKQIYEYRFVKDECREDLRV